MNAYVDYTRIMNDKDALKSEIMSLIQNHKYLVEPLFAFNNSTTLDLKNISKTYGMIHKDTRSIYHDHNRTTFALGFFSDSEINHIFKKLGSQFIKNIIQEYPQEAACSSYVVNKFFSNFDKLYQAKLLSVYKSNRLLEKNLNLIDDYISVNPFLVIDYSATLSKLTNYNEIQLNAIKQNANISTLIISDFNKKYLKSRHSNIYDLINSYNNDYLLNHLDKVFSSIKGEEISISSHDKPKNLTKVYFERAMNNVDLNNVIYLSLTEISKIFYRDFDAKQTPLFVEQYPDESISPLGNLGNIANVFMHKDIMKIVVDIKEIEFDNKAVNINLKTKDSDISYDDFM